MTTLPWASIRRAEAGTARTAAPTARILPFSITTVPFLIVPCGPSVWIVASVIATVSAAGGPPAAEQGEAGEEDQEPSSVSSLHLPASRMPSSKSDSRLAGGSLRS